MTSAGHHTHNGKRQLIVNVFNTFILLEKNTTYFKNPRFVSRPFLIYDRQNLCFIDKKYLNQQRYHNVAIILRERF